MTPSSSPQTLAAPATASDTTTPVHTLVVVGSNRDGRFGSVVAEWLLAGLRGRTDLALDVLDLADHELPTRLGAPPAALASDITPKLAAADAFVILTPEYNHSFPASLKSLIDWHFTEWQAKPVGLVSYGGVSGGLRAVEHLRQVFAELHAVTVRDTVSFHNAGGLFDEHGAHRDPAAADAALATMADRLVWWAEALREAKSRRPYGA
ncbi:NADPH-dependent FMN reductase [Streptomyces sp. NPDC050560]|uniref:NADPH-dependent FMN reductase n=1 Tax=Streptomyces sp. NPDC050560 TaxID=3365630 RepID=UPI0037919B40